MNRQIYNWIDGTYNEFDIRLHNNITYQVKQWVTTTSEEPWTGSSWVIVNYWKQYNPSIKYNRWDLVIYDNRLYTAEDLTVQGVIPWTNNSFSEIAVKTNKHTKFIIRTNDIEDVAPTEYAHPNNKATAIVFLINWVKEYYTFDWSNWMKDIKDQPSINTIDKFTASDEQTAYGLSNTVSNPNDSLLTINGLGVDYPTGYTISWSTLNLTSDYADKVKSWWKVRIEYK